MTREDHLLVLLAEECAEVAKEACKALRFGANNFGPNDPTTNADLIVKEYADLMAVVEMLSDEKIINFRDASVVRKMVNGKKSKIEKLLDYSLEVGKLEVE